MRKIELREGETRNRALEKEIVPLDSGPDGARDYGAAELREVLSFS